MRLEDYRDDVFAIKKDSGEVAILYRLDEDNRVAYSIVDEDYYLYNNETLRGDLSEFDLYPYVAIDAMTYSKLLRLETSIEEVMPNHECYPAFKVVGKFDNLAADVLCGLRKLLLPEHKATIRELLKWYPIIRYCHEVFGFSNTDYIYSQRICRMDDEEILRTHICDFNEECAWLYGSDYDQKLHYSDFNNLLSDFELLVENWGKPFEEKEFSYIALQEFIKSNDEKEFKTMDEETKKRYRLCMDKLCIIDSNTLLMLGDMIYKGNSIFKKDWSRCCDIYEEYYERSGDASIMDILGDLYCSGCRNGGVGEYDKAFRCYSIGHAVGDNKSSIKLGDLFAKGLGTRKNEEAAIEIYWKVYADEKEHFTKGWFCCEFVNAATRLGDYYKNGIESVNNDDLALCFFLEANLAIRKRMELVKRDDDLDILAYIQKSLNELLKDTKAKMTMKSDYPFVLKHIMRDGRRIKVKVKEDKDSSYRLEARYLMTLEEIDEDDVEPYILLTCSEIAHSGLYDKVVMKAAKNAKVDIVDGSDEFIYNHMNKYNDAWHFYYDEKLTAIIKADEFSFRARKY